MCHVPDVLPRVGRRSPLRQMRHAHAWLDSVAVEPAHLLHALCILRTGDDLMDALTLLVLSKAQPRARVYDVRKPHRIMCVAHVVTEFAHIYEPYDEPGPQGHCAVCGKALRRPRMT